MKRQRRERALRREHQDQILPEIHQPDSHPHEREQRDEREERVDDGSGQERPGVDRSSFRRATGKDAAGAQTEERNRDREEGKVGT